MKAQAWLSCKGHDKHSKGAAGEVAHPPPAPPWQGGESGQLPCLRERLPRFARSDTCTHVIANGVKQSSVPNELPFRMTIITDKSLFSMIKYHLTAVGFQMEGKLLQFLQGGAHAVLFFARAVQEHKTTSTSASDFATQSASFGR